jgi:hypothetical protein
VKATPAAASFGLAKSGCELYEAEAMQAEKRRRSQAQL